MWKFCEKAKFLHSFGRIGRIARNYAETAFPPNFHTRKLSEITVFFAVRDNANVMVTFLSIQKQQDGLNYGLFAVAFAAEIIDYKSTKDAVFHVPQLRNHLIYCLESGALTPFPKI